MQLPSTFLRNLCAIALFSCFGLGCAVDASETDAGASAEAHDADSPVLPENFENFGVSQGLGDELPPAVAPGEAADLTDRGLRAVPQESDADQLIDKWTNISTCTGVEVTVINRWVKLNDVSSFIKVLYVYYWVENCIFGTGWEKEGLANETIQYGFSHMWHDQALFNAYNSTGATTVHKWAVYYKIRKPNGNFTGTVYEIVSPERITSSSRIAGETCVSNAKYYLPVDGRWVL
jgi:hypothetical protein